MRCCPGNEAARTRGTKTPYKRKKDKRTKRACMCIHLPPSELSASRLWGHVRLVLRCFIGSSFCSTLLFCALTEASLSCHPAPFLGQCSSIVESRQLTGSEPASHSVTPAFQFTILLVRKEKPWMTRHWCLQDFGYIYVFLFTYMYKSTESPILWEWRNQTSPHTDWFWWSHWYLWPSLTHFVVCLQHLVGRLQFQSLSRHFK